MRLLMVSFDAVGDAFFERLCQHRHFAALVRRAAVARGVQSVFLTNTYPVHTSVITGVPPAVHGLVSNKEPFPKPHPAWCTDAQLIRAPTLWQAAYKKGLSVAAVLWPATGRAKEIRWNLPELMPMPGQNQLLRNLASGSKWMQMDAWLRHRKKLDGISQPALDDFATACMVDTLRRHKPGLALMHLTALDSLSHAHGPKAPEMERALACLDANLGRLLAAAGPETAVLLFSDHAQLPVHTPLVPNQWLHNLGLLGRDDKGSWVPGHCYFECCGGSAFLWGRHLTEAALARIRSMLQKSEGFGRFLTPEEMKGCGRAALPMGFCAAPGYSYEAYASREKGQHGYPLNYPDYRVFYMAAGPPFAAGATLQGGSLLDIAPLAAAALGLQMPGLPPARKDFFAGEQGDKKQ